jgi:AmmeMemoRadiSam system protein A
MNSYALLAKKAVENYIKKGEVIEPFPGLAEELFEKRTGVFVTIEKKGQLKGCIGTYLPTRPTLAEEIIRNAVAAATEDYRFGSVKEEELPSLSYKVYVLSEPRPVEDIKSLDPKKFGIIVKTAPLVYPAHNNVEFDGVTHQKTGLLLPDLEGVNNPKEQFALACQKGKINPKKEKVFIYCFSVEKY